MAKIKIRRKDLKRDEVKDFTVHALEWCQKNPAIVIGTIAVIAVVYIGNYAFHAHTRSKIEKINTEYASAYNKYIKAVIEEDAVARVPLLNESEAALIDVAKKHPDTVLGRQAKMLLGNQYYLMDQLDKAEEVYNELLKTSTSGLEKAKALLALGDCSDSRAFLADDADQKQNMVEKSLDYYKQAHDAAPNSYLGVFAMLKQVHILKKDPESREEALALCEKIKETRPADNSSVLTGMNNEKYNLVEQNDIDMLMEASHDRTFYGLAEVEIKQIKEMMGEE